MPQIVKGRGRGRSSRGYGTLPTPSHPLDPLLATSESDRSSPRPCEVTGAWDQGISKEDSKQAILVHKRIVSRDVQECINYNKTQFGLATAQHAKICMYFELSVTHTHTADSWTL